jgi:CheY-like chemotaxis protein
MTPRREPVKVLVVDDHLQYARIMALLLELEWQGCSIAFAASGNEAMDRLAADSFDLVISDVQMPGMSGYDLLHNIQMHYPDLPVILMSVFAEEGMRDLAVAWGAVALLEKPPSRPLKNSFPRETAFVSRWHYAPKFQSFLENMAFSAAC